MTRPIEVCKDLVENGYQEIALCPGFGHDDVARVAEAVGNYAAVAVARVDHKGEKT